MNYRKIYLNLIYTCTNRNGKPLHNFGSRRQNRKEGFEVHHIIPDSWGGSDHKNNLVYMTFREHYLAHHLLAILCGGSQAYAFLRMSKKGKCTSRQFSTAKKLNSQALSEKMKGNQINKGRVISEETKEKIRLALTGRKKPPMSEAQKKAISETLTGRSGKRHSQESRLKMREARKNVPLVLCPHCEKYFTPQLLARWHGDNCKHKDI